MFSYDRVCELLDRIAQPLPENDGGWAWVVEVPDEGYIYISDDLETYHSYYNPDRMMEAMDADFPAL